MTRHSDHADLMTKRRELVARLRLRKLSQREIVAALAAQGMVNPDTGKPWDVKQINRDLKHIRAGWLAATMEVTGEHRARQCAELDEVKREAVKVGDLRAWLAAIKQESELLGTAAPRRVELTWQEEAEAEGFNAAAIFGEMVAAARAQIEARKALPGVTP